MTVTVRHVKYATALVYGVPVSELDGVSRLVRYAHPRQVAYCVARRLTKKSISAIAQDFGGRHHTTVMHGIDAVKRRNNPDEIELMDTVERLTILSADWISAVPFEHRNHATFKSSRNAA